jgi:hypothetical protein
MNRATDNELLAELRISPLANSLTQRAANRIEELLDAVRQLEIRASEAYGYPPA